MSKAISMTRQFAADRVEIMRAGAVYCCALALIAAGPAFPALAI